MPCPVTTLPAMRISPAAGVRNPAITLSKVDLPQPDGPTMQTNSDALMPNDTPCTPVTLPAGVSYSSVTLSISIGTMNYPFAARTMPQRNTVARSMEPNTTRSNTKPITPMTTSEAIITSVCRNSLASKITQPRP